MNKSRRRKTESTLKGAGGIEVGKDVGTREGLILDDVLTYIRDARKDYNLPEPTLSLEQIEREPAAKSAVEEIIEDTIARHGTRIYSKTTDLFKKIYDVRRGKRINKPRLYSGWRISPTHAADVLRSLLLRALQTILQLPSQDTSFKDGTRELRKLAVHCEKLAEEINRAFTTREISNRASTYFREGNSSRLEEIFRVAKELQHTAETFRTILARTQLVKEKMDSPNPQVRFALYLIGWFEASTGKKQYSRFKTLLNAAYPANQGGPPAWVHRLEIEMTRKLARRKAWIRPKLVSPFPFCRPKALQISN